MVDGSGAVLTEQELITKKENQDSCKEGGRGEGGRERGEREIGVGREGKRDKSRPYHLDHKGHEHTSIM